MRETRLSGSEGGGAESNRPSLPLSVIPLLTAGLGFEAVILNTSSALLILFVSGHGPDFP
jgi:hypothetical protein